MRAKSSISLGILRAQILGQVRTQQAVQPRSLSRSLRMLKLCVILPDYAEKLIQAHARHLSQLLCNHHIKSVTVKPR